MFHKTTENLTKVFYTFDTNMVILVWRGADLSWGQTYDWFTHMHRHRQQQYLEAKTGLGYKPYSMFYYV